MEATISGFSGGNTVELSMIVDSYGEYTWTNLFAGNYVIGISDEECSVSDFFEIGTTSNLEMACSGNATSYPDATDGSVTIEVSGVYSQMMATVNGNAQFFNSSGTYTFGSLPAGTYEVVITESGEQIETCEVTITDGVVDACEDPLGLAGEDKTICPSETTTIGCEPVEGYCYIWSPTDDFSDPSMAHSSMPEVSPEETTTYSLTITNDEGNIVAEDLEADVQIIDSNPSDMLEYFINNDFLVIPIEITDLPGFQGNNSNNNLLPSSCIINDYAELIIEFEEGSQAGTPINLAEELLNNCEPNTTYNITSNITLCENKSIIEQEMTSCTNLVFWYHIFDNSMIDPELPDYLFYKHNGAYLSSSACATASMGDVNVLGDCEDIILSVPESQLDDFSYSVTYRAFAPWIDFGNNPLQTKPNSFEGDNRGFSLKDFRETAEIDENRVTSKLSMTSSFSIGNDSNPLIVDAKSSGTVGLLNSCTGAFGILCSQVENRCDWDDPGMCRERATPSKEGWFVDNVLYMQSEASNPCVTGSTDIDLRTKIGFSVEYLGPYTGSTFTTLIVKGIALNKKFPASEIYIEDKFGKKLFLYTFAPEGEDDIFSPGLLADIYDEIGNFYFRIPIGNQGEFLENISVGQFSNADFTCGTSPNFPLANVSCNPALSFDGFNETTITEWNETHLSKNPSSDCLEIPCCGNEGCCE